jgi:hypothetical protein
MTQDTEEVFTAVENSFAGVDLENSLDGVINRGRRIRGRRRTLTAAAAMGAAGVTALAVVLPSNGPATGDPTQRTGDTDLSGSQILLAAAHQAEAVPTTGRYWHFQVDIEFSSEVGNKPTRHSRTESWTQRDGRSWTGWRELTGARAGTAGLFKDQGVRKFGVCDKEMTYQQIVAFPTDPAALRATLVAAMKHNDDGPVPANEQNQFVANCLSGLLTDVPASPQVRAAAYRAFAKSPDVTVTGKTTDPRGRAGVGITITGPSGTTTRLVIDPSTSSVLSRQSTHVYSGHGVMSPAPKWKVGTVLATDTWVYGKIGWTDEKPHIPAA